MRRALVAAVWLLRFAAWAGVAVAGCAPYWVPRAGAVLGLVEACACVSVPVAALAAVGTVAPLRRGSGLARRRAYLLVFAVVGLCGTAGAVAVVEAAAARSAWAGVGLGVVWGCVLLAAAFLGEPDDLPPRPLAGRPG